MASIGYFPIQLVLEVPKLPLEAILCSEWDINE